MINSQQYPWLNNDKEYLLTLSARLPHAILLNGSKELGVVTLALWFAKSLLCENIGSNGACNQCQNCILFDDESQVDFKHLMLSDEKKSITIEDVRQVIEYITVSTHSNKYKIVLIEDVDTLNISSANALLKILEEAPSYAVFVLTCTNKNRVIPTVLSRCHQYQIKPPKIEQLSSYIAEQNVSPFWLTFYNNCPIFEEPMDGEQLTMFIQTLTTPSSDNIFQLTVDFDGKTIPFSVFLDFFSKWLSDLVQLKLINKVKYFTDYLNELQTLVDKLNIEKAFYLFDQVNFLSAWSNHPLNYKIQIENILFNYQMLFAKL